MEILANTPSEIWAAFIASLLTLLGVIATNRHHRKVIKIQLEHDASEKDRDRRIGARKELYLKAAEEVSKVSAYLGGLAYVDIAKVNIGKGLAGFNVIAAQISLITESSTGRILTELVTLYSELIIDVGMRLSPISEFMTEIDIRVRFQDQNQKELDRIAAERQRLLEEAKFDKVRFDVLDDRFRYVMSANQSLMSELHELRKGLQAEQIKFNRYLFECLIPIMKLQTELNVCFRQELGFDSDINEFAERLEEQRVRLLGKLEELYASIDQGKDGN